MYTDRLSKDLVKKSEKRWGNIAGEFQKELEETANQILTIYKYDLPPENEPAFFLKSHLSMHKGDFYE
jgi:hypothetical protein